MTETQDNRTTRESVCWAGIGYVYIFNVFSLIFQDLFHNYTHELYRSYVIHINSRENCKFTVAIPLGYFFETGNLWQPELPGAMFFTAEKQGWIFWWMIGWLSLLTNSYFAFEQGSHESK